jgi:chromosome segregation ATPase
MSERVDKFCAALQNKLNDLENRMNSLKTNLKSAPKQAEETLHKQLSQSQKKAESQKQTIEAAKTSVRNWLDQRKADATATVEQWKAQHETKKLTQRADRAEEYAAAAIQVAGSSFDEAEQAILEALVARIDADAVPA